MKGHVDKSMGIGRLMEDSLSLKIQRWDIVVYYMKLVTMK
jgi:hypothetical protein